MIALFKVIFRTHKDMDEFCDIVSIFNSNTSILDGDITNYIDAKDFGLVSQLGLSQKLFVRIIGNGVEDVSELKEKLRKFIV